MKSVYFFYDIAGEATKESEACETEERAGCLEEMLRELEWELIKNNK